MVFHHRPYFLTFSVVNTVFHLSAMKNIVQHLVVATLVVISSVTAFVPLKIQNNHVSSSFVLKDPLLQQDVAIVTEEMRADGDPETAMDEDEEDNRVPTQSWTDVPPKRNTLKKPVHHHVCPQTGITLSRYMMDMEHLNPELREVESIFTSIQVACKAISKLVRTASLQSNTDLQAGGGSVNVQGEEQKKLDILANDVLKNALGWAGKLKTIASEEDESPVATTGSQRLYQERALIDSGVSYIAVSSLRYFMIWLPVLWRFYLEANRLVPLLGI